MLGSTESGKTWCIKALHPSDPLTEVVGIPDQFSGATTVLNWQRTITITAAAGATGTWDVDILLNPTPTAFGYYKRVDSAGTVYGEVVNTQMGASHDDAEQAVSTGFERWRMAYCGVTAYQDGPALSNQGTVAAAQFPAMPKIYAAAYVPNSPINVWQAYNALREIEVWQTADRPDFTKLQSMPNAYFGESKDGCYMPLKLSANHQQWHGPFDNHLFGGLVLERYGYKANSVANSASLSAGLAWPLMSANGSEIAYSDTQTTVSFTSATAMKSIPPYPDASSVGVLMDANTIAGSTKIEKLLGSTVNCPCNDTLGGICFKGLSVSTQVVLYYRVGFEVMVQPGTSFAPYLKLSPAFDPEAITAYFKVARELKDAFPADFNDLGKLWGVIKDAAKAVLPVAGSIFPAISPITSAVSGMLGGGENPAPVMVAPGAKKRDQLPAAMVERVQRIAPQMLAAAKTRLKKPGKAAKTKKR